METHNKATRGRLRLVGPVAVDKGQQHLQELRLREPKHVLDGFEEGRCEIRLAVRLSEGDPQRGLLLSTVSRESALALPLGREPGADGIGLVFLG